MKNNCFLKQKYLMGRVALLYTFANTFNGLMEDGFSFASTFSL